ncbi:PH domain-containing protein [Saccharothrix sp. ST-888]|uniref:PH domain-containing protein n=1 Tax=Saccharothrix sp. ST-888 TaxID=1427391 RepID=UPI0005EC7C7A|nr:PH domain-containing protein [Saccharothrix sp. ST-888]KJK58906.1 membrane protein [Saccharothrix sp. ST-888]
MTTSAESTKPAASGALPVSWAPRRNRAVLLTLCTVLLVLFSTIAFALPDNWQLNDRLAMVCSGLLFAGAGLMLARPRVSADEQGVTVVNFVRSRRLAWAEIVRVNLRQGDPWVTLDLADGTALAAVGIQPAGGRDQAVRAARALRDLVEERGTSR